VIDWFVHYFSAVSTTAIIYLWKSLPDQNCMSISHQAYFSLQNMQLHTSKAHLNLQSKWQVR